MNSENLRLDAERMLAGINALPSLPTMVAELLASIDDAAADTDAIARRIAHDQGLTTRILRVANSPFYGHSHRIASIADAVIVLGLRSVRALAVAASFASVFKAGTDTEEELRAFWKHGIAAALCARVLARRVGVPEEEAFIGGLLHDIGRVALVTCFPRHMAAVAAYRRERDCPPIDAERAVLGIDHAEVGRLLAERWRFPPALCAAIGCHHAPPADAYRALPGILHLANVIASALDVGGEADALVPCPDPACWEAAALSADESERLFAEVEAQFGEICEILV